MRVLFDICQSINACLMRINGCFTASSSSPHKPSATSARLSVLARPFRVGAHHLACLVHPETPVHPLAIMIFKAFHKNAKTCRAGFHKKPTKQDGTHMTIRSQITIPTSIFPTTHTIIPYSLFWNGCVYTRCCE